MTTTAVFDSSYRERTFNVFESCEEDKQSGLSCRKNSASLSMSLQTVGVWCVLWLETPSISSPGTDTSWSLESIRGF